jgi:DNA sulfur modification protein DndD
VMLLKRVELENFGPYCGAHHLDFKGSSEELVLVHGENMAGKTSLLNAIRWCLYGEAKDRSGEAMPTARLINLDAYSEGSKRVSVALEVVQRKDGEESLIRLRRQHQAKQDVADPSADKDFAEVLEVDVDGNVLAGDQFDDMVNSMLPVRISRFFLFDGELLKEYEELVHEDSTTHARQVQRAIEMILGVPAAQNGKDDLSALHGELSRAYNKEARKHKALAESAKEAEVLQDEVDGLASELEKLLSQQEEASAELRTTQEELAKHEHLAESARALLQAEETIQSLVKERAEKEAKRREHASELWRDVLEPRLQHEVAKLEGEREQIAAALREKNDLDRKLSEAETSLANEECSTCGQPIPEEMRLSHQTRVKEIRAALAALEPSADQGRFDELGTTIRRMREIAPAGVASAIGEIESDLARIAIQIHKTERMKEDTESDLRGFDKKVVPRFEEKRDRLKKHLWQIEQSIEQSEKTLVEKRASLRDSQRAMTEKDEPALRHLRIQRDLLSNLATIYEASIDELIADRRSRVEAQASSIFRELTTDKSYSGLAINRNYGLSILAADGNSVPVRSAGAEQVVALSLIGALNRLAALRGPVIMDTPFGRLDRQHRENIMRFAPTLADQVVLLVHSGEIDPARDLEPVKRKVSAEYEIRHVESSRSEITARER